MNIIRNIFILGLLNFALVLGVLLAGKVAGNEPNTQVIPSFLSPTPSVSLSATISLSPTPTVAVEKINVVTKPKITPQVTPTGNPTAAPTPTTDPLAGKCIIYIDGVRYDMTEFRNIHSGGDIFQCGTDMSAIFHGQHPASYLDKIAKYKI